MTEPSRKSGTIVLQENKSIAYLYRAFKIHINYLTFLLLISTKRSPERSPADRAALSKSTDLIKTGSFPRNVTPKPPSCDLGRTSSLILETTTRLGGTLTDLRASSTTYKKQTLITGFNEK